VEVHGELAHTTGSHSDVADVILRRSRELGANTIVLGAETRHGPLAARVSAEIVGRAPTHLIVLRPSAGPLASASAQPSAPEPRELRRTQTS
jgi:hypothetical protein